MKPKKRICKVPIVDLRPKGQTIVVSATVVGVGRSAYTVLR